MSYLKLTIKHLPFILLLTLSACFATTPTPNAADSPSNSSLPELPVVEAQDIPIASSAEVAYIPLSIDYLRLRTYEGSDFVFEQTLDPGSNYNRYIVSYRSDGLKIYALMT